MLINLSNHPFPTWGKEQSLCATSSYGEVVDIPFPLVDPSGDEDYINDLANDLVEQIISIGDPCHVTVHLMGEMNLTFKTISLLKDKGYNCVASTTDRIVTLNPDGTKTVSFCFKRFRRF